MRYCSAIALATLLAGHCLADEYRPGYLDAADPIHVDYDDSLDYPYAVPTRFSVDGDVRGGYFDTRVDARDGSTDDNDVYRLRLRLGGNYSFSESWRLRGRLAAICSDDECSPEFETSRTPSAGTTAADGDIVVDELYLAWDHAAWSAAVGRLQTRSLARGGVFATAMTRLTSPNVAVNWTDGAMLRYRAGNGWTTKLIAQYNDEDGSSTLARPPLDFEDDDSRLSGFWSLERLRPGQALSQLGVDVVYQPGALLADGPAQSSPEDYWNVIGRAAGELPLGRPGSALLWAGQLGYAPETQSERVAGTGLTGDVDGWAWHVDASWMNFLPRHSIGVSYGVTDPGWLMSVSFRPNEETFTLRYHWRPAPGAQLEIQGRWREERDQLLGSQRKRDTFDYRIRLTWAFDNA